MAKNINDFDQALEDLHSGKAIIVVDDLDREAEGDLVACAEKVTKETLIFAMLNARGLLCCPCSGEILDRLEIPLMVSKTNDKFETPFTVSVDHMETGTGMSVDDRILTINGLVSNNSKPEDFRKPGHLFPLRARKNLLLERRGHTEASIELMKLINTKQVAVIIEIMRPDAQMMRLPELKKFARKHGLQIIEIKEIYDRVYGKK